MNIEIIKKFIDNDPKKISKLYNSNRDSFLNFGKKYGLNYDELSDIYQESFIALRKHAIEGKLNTVKSTLKTYLFGIGKYKIYNELKNKKKHISYEINLHITDSVLPIEYEIEKEELTIEQQLLRTYFKKLGKKCKELLTLSFSRGLTNDEIVEMTNYANNSVVRSQKSRCIKTLKEMIKK